MLLLQRGKLLSRLPLRHRRVGRRVPLLTPRSLLLHPLLRSLLL